VCKLKYEAAVVNYMGLLLLRRVAVAYYVRRCGILLQIE